MLKDLISSQAKIEILKLLLFNSENSYYQRQISALTEQPIRAVQRELVKLTKNGLVEKSHQGNHIYYKINKNSSIFEELRRIFLKCTGIAEVLKEHLKKTNDIKIAFIYGSYAGGTESISSDIDVMIIGKISSKKVSSLLAKPKIQLGREINYAVFSLQELTKRIREKDNFALNVLKGNKIFIIGDRHDLKAITQPR